MVASQMQRRKPTRQVISMGAVYAGLLSAILFLSACGGGSSGGGGGGGFAGTYIGPATFNLSGGGVSESTTGAQQIVISGDNTVSVGDPGEPPVGTGALTGKSFTVNVPGSFANQPGIVCTGTVVVTGTVNGNTITGTFSSVQFVCNGIPISVTGNFSAQRTQAGTTSRTRPGVMELFRSGILELN